MPTLSQNGRPLALTTSLGEDVLLLTAVQGVEGISRPFAFSLELLNSPDNPVAFDALLGQPVTVSMRVAGAPERFIHGILRRLVQGKQVQTTDGKTTLIRYRAEVVPKFALLQKRVQNRIFQHMSVPAILAEVLSGLDVRVALTGEYYPRDYCVQYRESDFAFASRLMEEEGIAYFFEHRSDGHTMVVTDSTTAFVELPGQNRLLYSTVENLPATDRRVHDWEKQQDIIATQYSARDHSFELQDHDLEYQQALSGKVMAGGVAHVLAVAPARELTITDYPGRYAQRFDGVSSSGEAQADALAKVFDDGPRTVRIRMEQEAIESLQIRGSSNYCHATPGYSFALERHFNADGEYLLTEVEHTVNIGDSYLTGQELTVAYVNQFRCIPKGLTYRPQRRTPQPSIAGTQSATVVGPAGAQTCCDAYGRVKVQFRWDRHGKHDSRSSCWLRVAQPWAGSGFGSFHLPRVGHEVVVAFEEGDPDRPIIMGSVYNSTNLPPYQLPEQAMVTGLMSRSLTGTASNASELRIVDNVPGQEEVHLHAERNLITTAEDQHEMRIGNGLYFKVGGGASSNGGGNSGSGGGSSDTKEKFGVSWDVSEGWTRSCGHSNDEILGNSFNLTVGFTETISVAGELDVYVGNYTFLVVGTCAEIYAALHLEAYLQARYAITLEKDFSATPDKSEDIAGAYALTVGGLFDTNVLGEYKIGAKLDMTITALAEMTIGVALAMLTEVGGDMTTTVKGAKTTVVTGAMGTTVAGPLTIKAPLIDIIAGAASIKVSAAGVELCCGASKIAVRPDGITMSAPSITQREA